MPKRVDNNQRQLTLALRELGIAVQPLHTIGHGVPDLLVAFRGVNYLLEVKSETGKLTEDESKWIRIWPGQVAIVRTVDDVLEVLGLEVQ